jgi:hypothetical protein
MFVSKCFSGGRSRSESVGHRIAASTLGLQRAHRELVEDVKSPLET